MTAEAGWYCTQAGERLAGVGRVLSRTTSSASRKMVEALRDQRWLIYVTVGTFVASRLAKIVAR